MIQKSFDFFVSFLKEKEAMNHNITMHERMTCPVYFDNTSENYFPGFFADSDDLNSEHWGECVTMKFDKAKLLMTLSDGRTEYVDAIGNFYVIANVSSNNDVVDECGNLYENDSLFISGLKNTDFLPIDDSGKMVLYMKEPGWPVDVHMIVMETDGGITPVEKFIDQADRGSRISLLLKGRA